LSRILGGAISKKGVSKTEKVKEADEKQDKERYDGSGGDVGSRDVVCVWRDKRGSREKVEVVGDGCLFGRGWVGMRLMVVIFRRRGRLYTTAVVCKRKEKQVGEPDGKTTTATATTTTTNARKSIPVEGAAASQPTEE